MPLVVIGSWIVVGLLIGFIASKIIKSSDGPAFGILVAIGGALVLGIVSSIIGGSGVSAFTLKPLIAAAIGGAAGAVIWHAVRSRFVSHEVQTVRRSY
jgi:uncharacterized membrane protein YeaQ/YmgE (transglycosylase-associated protein family)